MEEARQHPAVTAELIAFSAVYFGGLLALVVGVILQFTVGSKSLLAAIAIYFLSRAATSFWQFARAGHVLWVKPTRGLAALWGLISLALAITISLAFWGRL